MNNIKRYISSFLFKIRFYFWERNTLKKIKNYYKENGSKSSLK